MADDQKFPANRRHGSSFRVTTYRRKVSSREGMGEEAKKIFLRYFPNNNVNPEAVSVDSLLDFPQDVSAELA